MTVTDTNYFHKRGITVNKVKTLCLEMGLNPCNWSHLRAVFEMCKVNLIKY